MYVCTFSSSRSIRNVRSISHTIARIQLTDNNYLYLPTYVLPTHSSHAHVPPPHTLLTLLTRTLTCSHSSSPHTPHTPHMHPHMLTLLLSTHSTHSSHAPSHAPSHAHTFPPPSLRLFPDLASMTSGLSLSTDNHTRMLLLRLHWFPLAPRPRYVCPRSSHVELSPVGDPTINSERLQSYVLHTYVSVCLCCYYVRMAIGDKEP